MAHAEKDKMQWLIERKKSIGGSESAAVMGLDDWRGPLDIYRDKITDKIEDIQNDVMWLGTVLEDPIANRYMDITNRQMRRQPLKVHPDYPFLSCSVDRQIVNDDRGPGIWECKTASNWYFRQMKMDGLAEKYIVQVQHNILVWGYTWGSICLMNRDNGELIHFDIDADKGIQDAIIKQCGLFWHEHIVPRIPPKAEPVEPSVKLPPVGGDLVKIDGEQWRQATENYAAAKKLQAEAAEAMNTAKLEITDLMTANSAGIAEGNGLRYYYKLIKGKPKTDTKSLLADNPDINVEDYQTRGNDYMTLRAFNLGGK